MATESQNIEFKESWRDEYLKWICGFANAQGGTLFVGISDNGDVCGVPDAKKLMEDIPNKVRDLLGILVTANLRDRDGLHYLEVVTEAYPYPVSFRGRYYQRSGATNQELKGASLDRFMLRKQGKSWDSVPVPYLTAGGLDNATFDLFRKYARQSGRMDEADLRDNNRGLLDKLRLYDGAYLKRAAALLFHPDPEKYVAGAYVKIGYFRENADLVYQDEIHGNLFRQVAVLMDLLCTKYMKAVITYEGIQRIETLPIPREALREALLNACINKDYAIPSPIQIRVFEDGLEIINAGTLPPDWTVDTLLSAHGSMPYNPSIANTFFRAGEIEAWGRGIERIVTACKQGGFATPEFRHDASGVWTIFRFEYPDRASGRQSGQKAARNRPETDPKQEQAKTILDLIRENPYISRKQIAACLDIHESSARRRLDALQKQGRIGRIGPDKGGHWEITE